MSGPIPLALPAIGERERELVADVLTSGRLALGPMVERFEHLVAAAVDAPHAVAVSSGTTGLHLAVRMAEISAGDEVITSPFSFVASANCVLYEGAKPVFVDIDPDTFNLDPAAVESAITPRTRAILPIDIFGYPVELDELRDIAARYELALIQDSCEALGARYRGQALGSHGHPTVFAFYPNKQITTGEGGALVVATEEEWRLAKSLANQGRADSGGWLEHARLGFNYRMSDVTAAIGVGQLEKLDEVLAARSTAATRYTEALDVVPGLETPCSDDPDHTRSWFVYVVKLASEIDREAVISQLADAGISTSRYLPSIHLQPYMREQFGFREGMFPVCEDTSSRTLALPFFTDITEHQQERVCDAVARAVSSTPSA